MTDKEYLVRATALGDQSSEPVGCGVVLVLDGNVVAGAYNLNVQRADNVAVYCSCEHALCIS